MKTSHKFIGFAALIIGLYLFLRERVKTDATDFIEYLGLKENPIRTESKAVVDRLKKETAIVDRSKTTAIIQLADDLHGQLRVAHIFRTDNDRAKLFNQIAALTNDELKAVTLAYGQRSVPYLKFNLGMIPSSLPQNLTEYFSGLPVYANSIHQRLRVANLLN